MHDLLNPDWIREALGRGEDRRARWEQLGYQMNSLGEALHEQSPIGGDEYLYSAACEIFLALEPDAAAAVLTHHCIHAAMLAVTAEQHEAWETLDAEAAACVRETRARVEREGNVVMPLGPNDYRIPEADPAGQAKWFAGWEAAMIWLRSARLERYDEVKDRAALAGAVRRSRSRAPRFE
jgi:hypothetical protein